MAIPTTYRMKKPILECAAKYNRPIPISTFHEYLIGRFQLTEEEQNRCYPSGNGPIFIKDSSRAFSDLVTKELLERSQTGYYCITEKGKEVLAKNEKIT